MQTLLRTAWKGMVWKEKRLRSLKQYRYMIIIYKLATCIVIKIVS